MMKTILWLKYYHKIQKIYDILDPILMDGAFRNLSHVILQNFSCLLVSEESISSCPTVIFIASLNNNFIVHPKGRHRFQFLVDVTVDINVPVNLKSSLIIHDGRLFRFSRFSTFSSSPFLGFLVFKFNTSRAFPSMIVFLVFFSAEK
jgi:hypothetical protein